MQPLVSIIVPIYNVASYLEKTIDSCIRQTYTNLEIILIDDGSTDESPRILEDRAAFDRRIKVFHKKNGGLSDARNFGMRHANGAYIFFLDGDDYITHNAIELMADVLERSDADIVVGRHSEVYPDGSEKEPSYRQDGMIVCEGKNVLIDYFTKEEAGRVSVWGKLYRRTVFDGIEFPVNYVHEDLFTTYRIYENAKKVVFLPNIVSFYTQREDSITKTMKRENIEVHVEYITTIIKWSREKDRSIQLSVEYSVWKMFFLFIGWIEKNKTLDEGNRLIPSLYKYLRDNTTSLIRNPYATSKEMWRYIRVRMGIFHFQNRSIYKCHRGRI